MSVFRHLGVLTWRPSASIMHVSVQTCCHQVFLQVLLTNGLLSNLVAAVDIFLFLPSPLFLLSKCVSLLLSFVSLYLLLHGKGSWTRKISSNAIWVLTYFCFRRSLTPLMMLWVVYKLLSPPDIIVQFQGSASTLLANHLFAPFLNMISVCCCPV